MLQYIALEAACKAANHTSRKTMTLNYIVDFKKWIAPHIEEVHGHTNPHIFLFKRNALGKSVMYYKNWTHDDFQPKDGVKLLKVNISSYIVIRCKHEGSRIQHMPCRHTSAIAIYI